MLWFAEFESFFLQRRLLEFFENTIFKGTSQTTWSRHLEVFSNTEMNKIEIESAYLLIKIRVQAQHRPEDTCLDMAPPTMLSPQLNGLEPLYVLPGEEHEADCGHPLVHLTQENHIKNYHTPTKLSKIKTNNDSPL